MRFEPGGIYHIYNRGNNHQRIFFKKENYLHFLRSTHKYLASASDILGWCLMPNHFHFVVMANEDSCAERSAFGGKSMQQLARNIGTMLSSYSQAINVQQGTSGSLFQQKTKAKPVRESFHSIIESQQDLHYLIAVIRYIHNNPVQAGLVNDAADWPYSSYLDYAGRRDGTLCKKEILLDLTLGKGLLD